MMRTKQEQIDDFARRSLDHLEEEEKLFKSKDEEDKVNVIDDNHRPLWQMVAFCDSKVFGFENIMASLFYASKTKKYSFNYRFMYGDGRKNWYHFKTKAGSHWHDRANFDPEEAKTEMRKVFAMLESTAGSKLEMRETEFTGKESMDEIMAIFQNSGLVNMAKVDPKTKTVEIIDPANFNELTL